ncbi:NlpC/P60 family protein [Cellulophaga lytica]|uniref:NLP/P60 protein n=1 Tax=Cellulophaga lytica (strain ATCC 23178 / DSM 7489 / JCM 8516 / NBRC 14961 / NCIMB 1423 / VKM B-1433 / Cy l20) TaxID=867900 RepID=F0RHG7_CELLC|nr:NlpC/P60 family protein [Cellulophaga lytica]ADY30233.1 NLP/P60 protein [Cellulophaga lytica DSM 7489]AIM61225.1 hydrolase Nlp/P60 [Cellulophaga lytica]WQG78832.1 NlpC/P60 family protein [Cellulophaga lytica]
MQYGICNLSIVPVRFTPEENSEMVAQLLYGDHFKVLEHRKFWSRIRIAFDGVEAWVSNNQFSFIDEDDYDALDATTDIALSSDLVAFISSSENDLMPVIVGSVLNGIPILNHSFEGNYIQGIQSKSKLVNTALLYLNSPYLAGGKTPFGTDSSGLTQMVYKINGYKLLRTAQEQSTQGEPLSFIEESEPGDLAFFDNKEGIIDHVGIIMQDNYIIHCHGKVRIDRIDHTGIFNAELKKYTHQLRVIKKII